VRLSLSINPILIQISAGERCSPLQKVTIYQENGRGAHIVRPCSLLHKIRLYCCLTSELYIRCYIEVINISCYDTAVAYNIDVISDINNSLEFLIIIASIEIRI